MYIEYHIYTIHDKLTVSGILPGPFYLALGKVYLLCILEFI